VARRKMSASEAEQVRANVHATTDYEVARDADWAIEAATEDLALKRKIFAQLEALMRPGAWITSNTSSLPAARIFSGAASIRTAPRHAFLRRRPGANPVVEVIDTPALDRAVLEDLRALFCTTGKSAAGHRRRALLHARPRVRQLVAMRRRIFWIGRAPPRSIRRPAEFVHAGPFFVLNLSERQPDHHRDPTRCRPTRKASTIVRPRYSAPPDMVHGIAGQKPCRWRRETAAAIRDRLLGI